jgi:hypothetical protein
MKIRSDYVSNSSSSSFIIDFSDKGACIDHQFMALLKHFNSVTVRGTCETKGQCDELKERARSLFGLGCIDEWIDEDECIWVELDSKNIDKESDAQIALIKDILSFKDSNMNCNGGDDYGSEAADAIQLATLLESRYKSIEISGDDHCDYTSIRGTDLDV